MPHYGSILSVACKLQYHIQEARQRTDTVATCTEIYVFKIRIEYATDCDDSPTTVQFHCLCIVSIYIYACIYIGHRLESYSCSITSTKTTSRCLCNFMPIDRKYINSNSEPCKYLPLAPRYGKKSPIFIQYEFYYLHLIHSFFGWKSNSWSNIMQLFSFHMNLFPWLRIRC